MYKGQRLIFPATTTTTTRHAKEAVWVVCSEETDIIEEDILFLPLPPTPTMSMSTVPSTISFSASSSECSSPRDAEQEAGGRRSWCCAMIKLATGLSLVVVSIALMARVAAWWRTQS